MNKSELQDAARLITSSNEILISGHVNPDGDSLGSTCALSLALKKLGKSVLAVSQDTIPDVYRFLVGSDDLASAVPAGIRFDLGIAVDCESLDRLGPVKDALSSCDKVLEIDHHPNGGRSSDYRLVDFTAAASGEIVLRLLQHMELPLDPDIAECLLTAIVTDTGSFRFSNVTSAALLAAATLVDAGASVSRIAEEVYESRSLASVRMLGHALTGTATTPDGRVAYTSITNSQLKSLGVAESETEGIVNYIRSVHGAMVGILFREGDNGSTKVSLRSREGYDISQVARQFGGGGHKVAAGCTVDRPLTEAVNLVLDAVHKWMGS